MNTSEIPIGPWRGWQKVLFRFFFIFYCIFIGPWDFLSLIPGANYVLQYYYQGTDVLVNFFNRNLFHIPSATKPPNGNGDYPEQWMMVCTCLVLALVGCIIWTLTDSKRKNYNKLNYWFSLGVRYTIILNGISYGIAKIFHLQMPFPNLSQLSTPLGDFLPMRFSWMFIGYSYSYQFFSGAMELLAAILLLFRKTATLGVLVSTGVFLNVMMLNLSYDIPVKINSISLVVLCLYLLAQELPRLYRFFFLEETAPSNIFVFPFTTKKRRILSTSAKCVFVALALYGQLDYVSFGLNSLSKRKMQAPITAGVYDVITQMKMTDTVTSNMPDSVYWQNIVFDRGYEGSIKTADTRFRQRYGRSYFSFQIDSAAKLISLKRVPGDSVFIAQFSYHIKDSVLIALYSYPRRDSMYLLLRKKTTPFPLAGRPFHWVSETNR